MLTLKKTINYEGDLALSPEKGIGLRFGCPLFSYQQSPKINNGKAARTQASVKAYVINHALDAKTYQADFPMGNLTGDDADDIENFLRYTLEAYGKGNVKNVSFAVDVEFILNHQLIGGTKLEAIYIIKKLEEFCKQNLYTTNPDQQTLSAYINDNLFLINKQVYTELLPDFHQISGSTDAFKLLHILQSIVEHAGLNPKDDAGYAGLSGNVLAEVFRTYEVKDTRKAEEFLKKYVDRLFDFSLHVPEIKFIEVKGVFAVKAPDEVVVTEDNLLFYDLSLEYSLKKTTQVSEFQTFHFDWKQNPNEILDNKVGFSFTAAGPIVTNNINDPVSVHVKGLNGSSLWLNDFGAADPLLQDLYIEVPLQVPNELSVTGGTEVNNEGLKLRGQVLELSKKCSLKELTVIVQAKKENDAEWRTVGAAKTNSSGSFSMPYPFGVYIQAQAIVSMAPNSAVAIAVMPDAGNNRTISDDFLYLLVEGQDCGEDDHDDDCECHSTKKASRLPDQEDLINSDEYSQDIGGSCINLSTPNRTLSEYGYKAIVRVSDPDVANYTLRKLANHSSQQVGNEWIGMHAFELTGGEQKIKRNPVDLSNPIKWQDAPDDQQSLSFYQSVTVATGHILHYKSVFKADGYSLGDLLYSLPLAPGQKKQIVVFDASHSLQAAESQSLSQGERLAAEISNERDILNQLGGNIGESLYGESTASTGGINASLGVAAIAGPVGGVLGVSGGYSTSGSSASQNSSRDVAQFFGEKLRQAITQNADSYRQQNASVITTVTEGQRYAATTEVVANHNHCHALTMLYFEVLRHFAIYQELTNVEECVFVPLLMTDFSRENVYKWQDLLAKYLLPISANTYLRAVSLLNTSRQHPLVKAFDANERIKTNYADVDFPNGRYDEEKINFIKGELHIRTNLPRPKTRYDRIKSLPVITQTVSHQEFDLQTANKSAVLAAATGGLSLLFGSPGVTKTVSEQVMVIGAIFDIFMTMDANYQSVPPANSIRVKDFKPTSYTMNFPGTGIPPVTIPISGADFFENDIVDKQRWETYAAILGYSDVFDMLNHYFSGRLIAEWDDIFKNDIAPVIFEKIVDSISVQGIQTDFTSTVKYYGGEQLIRLNLSGTTSNRRMDFPLTLELKSNSDTIKQLKQSVTLNIENTRILYSTAHYNGTLYSGNPGDDLLDGTLLYIPVSPDEQRNPRKEDVYLVNKLIEHLNSNLEYYNKVLWFKLDPDRRFMLLDGFHIQVFNDFGVPAELRSLASVVKNELITVAGNSLVFPVAEGYKVNQSYIQEKTEKGEVERVSLFEHYKPLSPVPPYRISISSKGVFVEAVQGACDACEKVKENTSQDWTKFTTDEPTPINPLTAPVPVVTDWKAVYKDFAPPIINIQNAPAAPAPGAGLEGLSELLGKAGIFKDITGLDANQQNAIKTYLSNQENARAFAEMAKGLSTQGHNTEHTDKIMDSIQAAKDSGAINDEDYGKLVKDHLQQQIDGGESKKAEQDKEKQAKPTLTDAAVKAADQGKDVKAQKTGADGTVESVDIKGNGADKLLAKATGAVPKLKQENEMACWATAATMMMNWKKGKTLRVQEVLAMAGDEYLTKFNNHEGLKSNEKDGFISALEMTGEPPASYSLQQYIDWLNTYGPLWITTDAADQEADFSPHARILTKITGTGSPDGKGTSFIFNDPATGTEMVEPFTEFIKAFEQMASDNPAELFIQVVHFTAAVSGAGNVEGGAAVIQDKFLTDIVNDPANQFSNSEDINRFFERTTGFDFVVFFNKFIGGRSNWAGINIATDELSAIRFMNIWDNVMTTLAVPSINLIQFLCLQSAINNETGGKMDIPSEGIGIKDFPGLKYTYSKIPKGYIPNYTGKISYNAKPDNKLAFDLFNDSDFIAAHGNLSGADALKNTTDTRWKTTAYPLAETNPNKLQFAAQADFHKFRGRGYIQLTWRTGYLLIIDFILKYTGTNPVILQHQSSWLSQSAKPLSQLSDKEYGALKHKIATITSNQDWDELFQQTDAIIALKVLDLHVSGSVLKKIKTDNGQNCKKSILAYGASLNGGNYKVKLFNRVMQLLGKLGNT